MSLSMSQVDTDQSNRIPIFNGQNYPIWKKKILAYLTIRGLSDTITTKISVEEQKLDFHIQNKAPYRAYSILLLALTDEQARFIMHVPDGDAMGVWETLLELYERKSVASLSNTRGLLHASEMKEDEKFDVYLARIKELQVKLTQMGEAPSTSELRHVLLNGLPTGYKEIVNTLNIGSIGFEAACSHIRDYQEKCEYEQSKKSKETDEAANYAENRSRIEQGNSGKGRPDYKNNHHNKSRTGMRCYTCDKPGHRAFDCSENEDKKKCHYCRKLGHTDEECGYKNRTSNKEVSF